MLRTSPQPSPSEAPLWALLIGDFVPDLLWIELARIGVEHAHPSSFFDDWSHSLALSQFWRASLH